MGFVTNWKLRKRWFCQRRWLRWGGGGEIGGGELGPVTRSRGAGIRNSEKDGVGLVPGVKVWTSFDRKRTGKKGEKRVGSICCWTKGVRERGVGGGKEGRGNPRA